MHVSLAVIKTLVFQGLSHWACTSVSLLVVEGQTVTSDCQGTVKDYQWLWLIQNPNIISNCIMSKGDKNLMIRYNWAHLIKYKGHHLKIVDIVLEIIKQQCQFCLLVCFMFLARKRKWSVNGLMSDNCGEVFTVSHGVHGRECHFSPSVMASLSTEWGDFTEIDIDYMTCLRSLSCFPAHERRKKNYSFKSLSRISYFHAILKKIDLQWE